MPSHLKILKELERLRNNKTLPKEFCEKINLEQRFIDKIILLFNENCLEVGFLIDCGNSEIDIKTFPFEKITDYLLESDLNFFNILFDENAKYSKDELKIILKNIQ